MGIWWFLSFCSCLWTESSSSSVVPRASIPTENIVTYVGNKGRYGKGVRIRGFTEGMWEIENTPRVCSKQKVRRTHTHSLFHTQTHSLSLSQTRTHMHTHSTLCLCASRPRLDQPHAQTILRGDTRHTVSRHRQGDSTMADIFQLMFSSHNLGFNQWLLFSISQGCNVKTNRLRWGRWKFYPPFGKVNDQQFTLFWRIWRTREMNCLILCHLCCKL